MNETRKLYKRYYVRQAICLCLSVWMILGPIPFAKAVVDPASNALPEMRGGDLSNFDRNLTDSILTLNEVANGTIYNWNNFDKMGLLNEIKHF